MIKILIGSKGSGKTKHMIDAVNAAVVNEAGNVVFLSKGKRLMYILNHSIRFIDTSDFQIYSSDVFYGFLCGLIANDFDVSHIFIDSVWKIIPDEDPESFDKFLEKIEAVSKQFNIKFSMSISADKESASSNMKQFIEVV